tara:strand:- start:626 stop:1702 length:1077 start_codon:yes stop_codon:yes gene_type:complete
MAFDQPNLFGSPQNRERSRRAKRHAVISVDGIQLSTTPVFEAYWYFVHERQNMFRRRLEGLNRHEASEDKILASHRFTNVYRASDRVSQYLIRNVIWEAAELRSDDDLFFRILLFKLFNRIDTWEAISEALGPISLDNYSFERFDEFLSDRKAQGLRNYSAAYIMPSAGRVFGHASKHANHLRLIEWMLSEKYPERLRRSSTMSEGFELLLSAPSIGPFLAYQFITDLNYSELTNFTEEEFVGAGPGAIDGISKCFVDTQGISPERIIEHMARHQADYLDDYEFEFIDLWGRPLQFIDCQNVFCEISKYARAAFPDIAGRSRRSRIKQKYRPAGHLPRPWYPPNWGLNEKITADIGSY